MTFKSLLNFGSFGRNPTQAVDRYHSGPSDYGHYDHGWGHGGHKGKGGSGGAALSALTLLAFLFLINVMQQSLDSNNGTATPAVVREGDQSAAPRARGDQASTNIVINDSTPSIKYVPIKTSLQVVQNKN
ncbi:uncharacterized protein LOC124185134 [Neodiprion fabricii]|uniref:uncharacterized protein LOC124185134 n=1 Tax=Neodiprion fabricii TaxID=2872261 RepID=UPI001ED8FF72|nr:uncharacterized protein LOC124185134 [Neodiprion fabricii]